MYYNRENTHRNFLKPECRIDMEILPKAANVILMLNCAGLSSADSASCLCVVLVVGVRIAHPYHWRSTAGHGD